MLPPFSKKEFTLIMNIIFGKQKQYMYTRMYSFSLFGEGLKCNLAKHSREYST